MLITALQVEVGSLSMFILLFTGFLTFVWKFLSLTLRLKHLYSEEHATETCWMKLLPFEPGESLVFTSAMDHTWKVLGGIGDTSCSFGDFPNLCQLTSNLHSTRLCLHQSSRTVYGVHISFTVFSIQIHWLNWEISLICISFF